MTNHDKFKALLVKLGLNYKELATMLDMEPSSVKNQLSKTKELPRWAKSMLIVEMLTEETNTTL